MSQRPAPPAPSARRPAATIHRRRRRGLWPGEEPSGDITLGMRAGRLYQCDHWDGPFASAMRSYVVPHRGEELGLEFRSHAELHRVNQRILDSFAFLE